VQDQRAFTSNVRIDDAIKTLTDSKRLKIDDLLPLFPPNEKVAVMKDHLCKCLNDYKVKIDELKKELDTLSENAESLRN